MTWADVGGDVVVLDLRTSRFLRTNSTGAVLLRALAEDTSFVELATTLATRFGIDQATASDDVRAFLDQLEELGLLAEDESVPARETDLDV